MILRPRRDAPARASELASSLEVGDEVVTIGGLVRHDRLDRRREVELEVADGVTVRFARRAIAGKAPERRASRTARRATRRRPRGRRRARRTTTSSSDNFEHDETSQEEPVSENGSEGRRINRSLTH